MAPVPTWNRGHWLFPADSLGGALGAGSVRPENRDDHDDKRLWARAALAPPEEGSHNKHDCLMSMHGEMFPRPLPKGTPYSCGWGRGAPGEQQDTTSTASTPGSTYRLPWWPEGH